VWQALRTELSPLGLEIVTVALDSGGADAARPYVETAASEHPVLIDRGHLLGELLGIVNVPEAVWIDEQGVLVRPPEAAAPQEMGEMLTNLELPPETPERVVAMVEEAKKIRVASDAYLAALRHWVEAGAASPYALAPDEVVRRSRPRPAEVARAAACFELAQHLHREGHADDAVPWFREAHRLQPDNWTYRRQAWFFADPVLIGPTPGDEEAWPYDGDWLSDTRKIGAENYYAVADLATDGAKEA
jgi:hypothetical protein